MNLLIAIASFLVFSVAAHAENTQVGNIKNEMEAAFIKGESEATAKANELVQRYTDEALSLSPLNSPLANLPIQEDELHFNIKIKSKDKTLETKITHKEIRITKRF